MIAFVDESLRSSPTGRHYFVAVVVVASGDLERSRRRVRSVLLPRQPRFHWRDESERQRLAMLETFADLGPRAFVYRCPLGSRQERSRSLCIGRMLWDLRQIGAGELVIETREPHGDRKDRRTIGHARRDGRASPDLVYRFLRPTEEPLLWLPDALAGAAGSDWAGESRYLENIPGQLIETVVIGA